MAGVAWSDACCRLTRSVSTHSRTDQPPETGTTEAAQVAIRDLVAESLVNESHFDQLINFLYGHNMALSMTRSDQTRSEFRAQVFEQLSAGRIGTSPAYLSINTNGCLRILSAKRRTNSSLLKTQSS